MTASELGQLNGQNIPKEYSNTLIQPASEYTNNSMTLCIAAKYKGGKALVLVADKQASNQLGSYQDTDKILKLDNKVYLLVAGDEMLSKAVYEHVKGSGHANTEEWADAVKQHVADVRYQKAVDSVLLPRGMTNEAYLALQSNLHREVALNIDNSLANYQMPSVEFLIAGVDPDGEARIFYVGVSPIVQLAISVYGAIGAPVQAYFLLNSFKLNDRASYPVAVGDVFRVKKMCESLSGIGDKTDIVIIRDTGSTKLTAAKVAELDSMYQSIKDANDTSLTEYREGINE